jgi:hypothetical protein
MQTRSLVALPVAVLLSSAAALATSDPPAGASASQAAAAKVKEDFSTPRAAVETFFAAAAARDVDVVSRCFVEGRKEFEPLRNKQIPERELEAFSQEFGVGKVVGVEQGEQAAYVMVKLKSRDETIEMRKVGNAWKIYDF